MRELVCPLDKPLIVILLGEAPSEEIAKDALEWGKISQGALLEALRLGLWTLDSRHDRCCRYVEMLSKVPLPCVHDNS